MKDSSADPLTAHQALVLGDVTPLGALTCTSLGSVFPKCVRSGWRASGRRPSTASVPDRDPVFSHIGRAGERARHRIDHDGLSPAHEGAVLDTRGGQDAFVAARD
jgi:hypothetical protein